MTKQITYIATRRKTSINPEETLHLEGGKRKEAKETESIFVKASVYFCTRFIHDDLHDLHDYMNRAAFILYDSVVNGRPAFPGFIFSHKGSWLRIALRINTCGIMEGSRITVS